MEDKKSKKSKNFLDIKGRSNYIITVSRDKSAVGKRPETVRSLLGRNNVPRRDSGVILDKHTFRIFYGQIVRFARGKQKR